jgi:hypothetical protein
MPRRADEERALELSFGWEECFFHSLTQRQSVKGIFSSFFFLNSIPRSQVVASIEILHVTKTFLAQGVQSEKRSRFL